MMKKLTNDELTNLLETLDDDTEYARGIVDSLVHQCCDKLDQYVQYVFELLEGGSNNITDAELDDIIMTIPALLYFCGTQQELLGLKQDMSDVSKTTDYNDVYAETVGTEGHKKAVATNAVMNKTLVSTIYGSAHDIIKQKVSYATELLQSAKKVVSRRMSELELSKIAPTKIN